MESSALVFLLYFLTVWSLPLVRTYPAGRTLMVTVLGSA